MKEIRVSGEFWDFIIEVDFPRIVRETLIGTSEVNKGTVHVREMSSKNLHGKTRKVYTDKNGEYIIERDCRLPKGKIKIYND